MWQLFRKNTPVTRESGALAAARQMSDFELYEALGKWTERAPQRNAAMVELDRRQYWRRYAVAWVGLGVTVLSWIGSGVIALLVR